MITARIKNWGDFQHYKDRSPPWIKLHRGLLDDFNYARLPIASKALAPLIWLLAAESNDGTVDVTPEYLSFRTRMTVGEVNDGLNPLISYGFVILDSDVLAPRLQDACLEGEGEGETEREGEGEARKGRPARKGAKAKSGEVTLAQWIETLAGAEAIPADDAIFDWAIRQGIPGAWLGYAWGSFEDRYTTGTRAEKTYTDWRATFRDHVKRGWLDVWRHDARSNGYVLTTAGVQWQREMSA